MVEFPDERPPPGMRGRRVVYRPNHKSFGAFMKSEQIREPVIEAAQNIAGLARILAPRGEDPADGERAMADNFKVNRDAGFTKVGRNIRVKVDVFNDDPAAAPNEFGGKRNKRHRMLGRAGARHGTFKPEGGLNA